MYTIYMLEYSRIMKRMQSLISTSGQPSVPDIRSPIVPYSCPGHIHAHYATV